jgi:16S rRNA (guanine966-N2)-methyltransferase
LPSNPRNSVRIIGGAWRSRLVSFPASNGLRPTANRIRETLFNWLGQDLTGKTCLDLFAGSGALGFEAASRGATQVALVERDPDVYKALQRSSVKLAATNVFLSNKDAHSFIKSDREIYDIVFLDPPYTERVLARFLQYLPQRIHAESLVYVEDSQPLGYVGWCILRAGRAGKVHYGLLRLAS